MIRIKIIIPFLLCMGLSFLGQAQNAEPYYDDSVEVDQSVKPDVSPSEDEYTGEENDNVYYIDTSLYLRKPFFSIDSNTALKNSKDFAYVKNLDSLLKAYQEGQKPKRKETSSSGSSWVAEILSSKFMEGVLWTFAILFVLFIVYRLFFADGYFLQRKIKSNVNLLSEEEADIPSNTNYDKLIAKAFSDKDYRMAVRYLYLQSLQKLSEKGLIEYAEDKTNYQYVRELQNTTYGNRFAALTLRYEYIWYGEFTIDEMTYFKIRDEFKNFQSTL